MWEVALTIWLSFGGVALVVLLFKLAVRVVNNVRYNNQVWKLQNEVDNLEAELADLKHEQKRKR